MSGFSQISLNQRLQGSNKFLEIQTLNSNHLTLNSNAELSLTDDVTLSGDLNLTGDLNINGGITLGSGENVTANTFTATDKVVTDKIEFSDNVEAGLTIEASDGGDYIVCKSTNGSEQVQIKKTTFTDGNSVILGTNGSRGILQYGNVKNSTIDNTNTLSANTTGNASTATVATTLQTARNIGGVSFNGSASIDLAGVNTEGNQNTTGTASAWTSTRTTNFVTNGNTALGSLALKGDSNTTGQLNVPLFDQTGNFIKKLMLTNDNSSHTTVNLQHRIQFINTHMTGQQRTTDGLIGEIQYQKDMLFLKQYNNGLSESQETEPQYTKFVREDSYNFPSMNNLLYFDVDTQNTDGEFLEIHRDNNNDSNSTAFAQRFSGIKFYNKGLYSAGNLNGEMGGIKSYYFNNENGITQVYAKQFSGSSMIESKWIVKKDLFEMENATAIQFGSADRRITYNNSECAFTGSDDVFTFDNKVNIGVGLDSGNPAILGIENDGNIADGGADQELLSLKFTQGSSSTPHLYNFSGGNGGQLILGKTTYATSQDLYSGTKSTVNILDMNNTRINMYNAITGSSSALNIRPVSGGECLSLGMSSVAGEFWKHTIDGGADYSITTTGGRHFNLTTGAGGNLSLNTGSSANLNLTSTANLITASTGYTSISSSGGVFFYPVNNTGFSIKCNNSNNPIVKLPTTDNTNTDDYNFIINAPRPATTSGGAVMFINGSTRTADGGNNSLTLRNDSGSLLLGQVTMYSEMKGYQNIFETSTIAVHNAGAVRFFRYLSVDHWQTGTASGDHLNVVVWNGDLWIRENGGLILVSSDERVKEEIEIVDDDVALQQILALETKKYHYKDPSKRKPKKTIGFIAQDVEKIVPNAVAKEKCIIPDEMRELTDMELDWEGDRLYLELDMSGNNTGKVQFVVINKEGTEEEVRIDRQEDEAGKSYYLFDKDWKKDGVFLYGKEVDDFLAVDKQQIFALHHSGIQELHRKFEKLQTDYETKISNLEKVIEDLTKTVKLNENALKTLI